MSGWRLRARRVLDAQFAVVVVVLLAVAVLGGWLTYGTYVAPGTTSEQRTVSTWETSGRFAHAANVTRENPVYPVGTTFRNRSVYLAEVAPVVSGTFAFDYAASDGGDLEVTITQRSVVRSVDERGERTVGLWNRTRRLGRLNASSLAPSRTVRVPFSLNVTRTSAQTDRIEDGLGNPPGELRTSINATVRLTGTVNGRPVNRTVVYSLPVEFEGSTYRVAAEPDRRQYERTRTVTVPREPDGVGRVAGPLLLVASIAGLAGLVVARRRDALALTSAERERLAFEDDRADFDEWITAIDLPDEAADLPRAEARSLGDLVDYAIDTDRGVVEDPDGDAYYVVDDGFLYEYRPPSVDGGTDGPGVAKDAGGSPPPEESESDTPPPIEALGGDENGRERDA